MPDDATYEALTQAALVAALEEIEDRPALQAIMRSAVQQAFPAARAVNVAATMAHYVERVANAERLSLSASAAYALAAELAVRPERYPAVIRYIRTDPETPPARQLSS